jgi:hypothetical protein
VHQDQRLVSDLNFADPDILETFDRINEHLGTAFSGDHMDLTFEELADVILEKKRKS